MKKYWHWARALLAYSRVVRNTKRLDEVLQFINNFLAAQGDKGRELHNVCRTLPTLHPGPRKHKRRGQAA